MICTEEGGLGMKEGVTLCTDRGVVPSLMRPSIALGMGGGTLVMPCIGGSPLIVISQGDLVMLVLSLSSLENEPLMCPLWLLFCPHLCPIHLLVFS